MRTRLDIRPLKINDIPFVTELAKLEGFSPGLDDVAIYKNSDKQTIWIGTIDGEPIGCIAGIKYNQNYSFLGLYIVKPKFRRQGYGTILFNHVLSSLGDVQCIGLEAAPKLVNYYSRFGFLTSSTTTRLEIDSTNFKSNLFTQSLLSSNNLSILSGTQVPQNIIQIYDASKEATSRPHFLSDWLSSKPGTVLTLVNENGECVGFGRIRPCLMLNGNGFRIGPLIANSPLLANILIQSLLVSHPGIVLIDSPGLNPNSNELFSRLGFSVRSTTIRMYKGSQPKISLDEIYGLACLEFG